jgi:methionyl aminopeptidase
MTMGYIDATDAPPRHTNEIKLYGPEGFAGMRKAGRLAAECLDMLAPHVVPGVTTGKLDELAREFVIAGGGVPACLFYKGYRHTVCTSINHVVCHGIPGPKQLKEGDIVNIDVTVIVDGWHGDTSRMYAVGPVKRKSSRLMDVTYECLMKGIEVVKPGARLGDIGAAIQEHAERQRYSVVEAFCGHGLGRVFHDSPNILHFGRRGHGEELRAGMIFTIEPMINLGRRDVALLADGWTAVTRDRSLSAQYEHSIGVTETGFEIFTQSPTGLHTPHTSGAEAG